MPKPERLKRYLLVGASAFLVNAALAAVLDIVLYDRSIFRRAAPVSRSASS